MGLCIFSTNRANQAHIDRIIIYLTVSLIVAHFIGWYGKTPLSRLLQSLYYNRIWSKEQLPKTAVERHHSSHTRDRIQ